MIVRRISEFIEGLSARRPADDDAFNKGPAPRVVVFPRFPCSLTAAAELLGSIQEMCAVAALIRADIVARDLGEGTGAWRFWGPGDGHRLSVKYSRKFEG